MTPLPRYLAFYAFAAGLGVRNVARNGMSLGWRRTLGKLLQPINVLSRFPEYDVFLELLRPALRQPEAATLLDVGSPKPFGLYLARHHRVRAILSDINPANFADYRQLWRSARRPEDGPVHFAALDARRLPHPDASFDMVISMSVVEHIDSPNGDRKALAEMWRVLRPGGTMVVSVPFGARAVVQQREAFTYFAGHSSGKGFSFFQRIYDADMLKAMVAPCMGAVEPSVTFVHRARPMMLHLYLKLGLNTRALFGVAFPLLACLLMRTASRFDEAARVTERYTDICRIDDIYSDAVLSWRKPR